MTHDDFGGQKWHTVMDDPQKKIILGPGLLIFLQEGTCENVL